MCGSGSTQLASMTVLPSATLVSNFFTFVFVLIIALLSSYLNILVLYKGFCACPLMVAVSVSVLLVLPWDPCPVCVSLLFLALYPMSTLKLWALSCPVLESQEI